MSTVRQHSNVRQKEGRKALTVDGSHDEANLCCVGGTCKVCVDLLVLRLVQRHEPVEDIVAGSRVVCTTLVIREVVLHRADRQLLLEAVDLVQEQDDRRLDEPSRVADRVEQCQRLLHPVHRLIFEQHLVVFRDGHQEENGRDVLEAVDPLLPLRSLTTDVEHPVGQVADDEGGLRDTSRLDTRSKDILVGRQVVRGSNAVNRVKVATTS